MSIWWQIATGRKDSKYKIQKLGMSWNVSESRKDQYDWCEEENNAR